MTAFIHQVQLMSFAKRLVELRKQRGMSQAKLADKAGIHVQQVKRYEAATAQPTLEVLKALSLALGVTSDHLIFGKDARGPDEELRLQFEAISTFNAEEKRVVKALLDGLILKHEAKRWATG